MPGELTEEGRVFDAEEKESGKKDDGGRFRYLRLVECWINNKMNIISCTIKDERMKNTLT